MNKVELNMYTKTVNALNRFGERGVYDVYSVPSGAKCKEWYRIKDAAREFGARWLTIVSYNGYTFTAAYGNNEKTIFVTPYYDYELPFIIYKQ